MYAIEFQTNIADGIIEIPQQYRIQRPAHAKVIVLFEDVAQEAGALDQLLREPLRIPNFRPLTREAIYERR